MRGARVRQGAVRSDWKAAETGSGIGTGGTAGKVGLRIAKPRRAMHRPGFPESRRHSARVMYSWLRIRARIATGELFRSDPTQ